MAKPATNGVELIAYIREKRPPTLSQFVHRKHVGKIMSQVKGEGGVVNDPRRTGKRIPASALKARELIKGKKSEDLIAEHPEWVEEYKREYGDGAGNKEA